MGTEKSLATALRKRMSLVNQLRGLKTGREHIGPKHARLNRRPAYPSLKPTTLGRLRRLCIKHGVKPCA